MNKDPRDAIDDLLSLLGSGAYERFEAEFNKLCDAIIVEEKDKYYRQHPEETNG